MKEIIIDCINWFFEDGSRLEEAAKAIIAVCFTVGMFAILLVSIKSW